MTKISVTPQQYKNAVVLLEILEATPDTKVNLYHYVLSRECGTLHCSLGWACMSPHFQAQGLWLDDLFPVPTLDTGTELIDDDSYRVANVLFGEHYNFVDEYSQTWEDLFSGYGAGTWDKDILGDGPMGHKQLAIARLHKWIGMLEVDNGD